MIVLGLDLATKTGWAVLTLEGLISSGVFSMENMANSQKCLTFYQWLNKMIETYKPEAIVYEHPIIHKLNRSGVGSIKNLEGILFVACELFKVPFASVYPATLKKFATGSGRASKREMKDCAKTVFNEIKIIDDNHADALFLAKYNLEELEF